MTAQKIPINKIISNQGQIEGLPKNPRVQRNEQFERLKKSIQENPSMLDLRELLVVPHEDRFVVIAGNMRLRAMQELKFDSAPCKVLSPDTPAEKLRAYTILDNAQFGEWDWDDLANEWSAEDLTKWGVDLQKDYAEVNYSEKNKEIDVSQFEDQMEIKLKYSEQEYYYVSDKLSEISDNPGQAVIELIKKHES